MNEPNEWSAYLVVCDTDDDTNYKTRAETTLQKYSLRAYSKTVKECQTQHTYTRNTLEKLYIKFVIIYSLIFNIFSLAHSPKNC